MKIEQSVSIFTLLTPINQRALIYGKERSLTSDNLQKITPDNSDTIIFEFN